MLGYLGKKNWRKYCRTIEKMLEKSENKTKNLKGTTNRFKCAAIVLKNI